MLTKEDLSAIGDLIDEKMDKKFKKELRPIKLELKRIRRDMNLIVKFFYNEISSLRTRVNRLEIAF